MSIALLPGRRQRLGDQLYGQILEQILDGRLREGERLPPETELSGLFGVSRPVVREALMRLRADGLVQARQGAGTFVAQRPAERLSRFAAPQSLAALLRGVEVRLPLEGAAARLAAERRTSAQLATLRAAHEAFSAEASAGGMNPRSDLAFHMAVAAATGNEYFVLTLSHITEAVTGFMAVSLNLTRTGSPERARQVVHEHAQVLEAIRAQDAEVAQGAMQFHIGQARRRMLDQRRDP